MQDYDDPASDCGTGRATNNLSTAIIILGIGVVLIFVSRPWICQRFVGMGAAGVAVHHGFPGSRKLPAWNALADLAGIRRNTEKGFQTIQGLYAIGSGGIFGRGTGTAACRSWDSCRRRRMI